MTKILIIEDDLSVRDNLIDVLEAEQFEVIEAINGQDGINKALTHLPDLIISDIMMPEVDGYGVLEHLKSVDATSTIPFIFLSAKSEHDDLRNGMTLGAADYLTKPYTRNQLIEAVNTRLRIKLKTEAILEKTLTDFRSTITLALPHELRTPLTPLIGVAHMMLDNPDLVTAEDVKTFGELILTSSERLSRLIENYISFSGLEIALLDSQKREELLTRTTDFTDGYIHQATEVYFADRSQNRVADFEIKVESATTAIDSELLTKLIIELLDNACKFSDAGTPIRLLGQVKDNYYEIIFRDQGRGMTPEQIKNIGAYMQFERARHEQQGMGLGLTIVKRVVELYNGKMLIKSKPEHGTLVQIRLLRAG